MKKPIREHLKKSIQEHLKKSTGKYEGSPADIKTDSKEMTKDAPAKGKGKLPAFLMGKKGK